MHEYRHGVVDRVLPDRSIVLPPDWAPQVPDDWREVLLREAVPRALAQAGVGPDQVVGVGATAPRCPSCPARPGVRTPNYGGKVSGEWQYAKVMQLLDQGTELYAAADRWIEAAD
ncbi:hypothetical protein ACEZCY_24765 [Streptacidiphilus sp. N1-12]|uniref:Uncharacterized protein n=2 Tax=Streptacidiphilus alkalitolerans TaxID=3342712 RepID=A0ABV6V896_9ACTN